MPAAKGTVTKRPSKAPATKEMAIYKDENAVLPQDVVELSVEGVAHQVNKVQALMKRVLKKDTHYGRIPGTNRESLYKAGAEKIGLTFRVGQRIHEETTDLGDGHYDFSYRVELYHTPTGQFLGEGVGSASTKESKYRYRKGTIETKVQVPLAYRKTGKVEVLIEALKTAKVKIPDDAEEVVAVKNNNTGQLMVGFKVRMENKDIADIYNTVRKMGKKRAYVDAIISAFALSDIFTQDIEEDML